MVDEKESKPNGLAIAAMVLGICGFAILPIVFGAVQLSKIKKGEASGKGMAVAGLVIGIVRLVLAALVTIMVFVSLPSLQRSSRDTIRRNDYAIIASAITSYQSNNNGALPNALTDLENYIPNWDTEFVDPSSGDPYLTSGSVEYATGADCDGNAGQRYYCITGYLESSTEGYLLDNN